jgi:hypothetical protein
MRRTGGPRVTYANVVSTVALIIALGAGGAYAAAKIGSKQIKDGSIQSVDIQDNGVTGADVDEHTLGPIPFAQTALNANTADDATHADNATHSDNTGNLGGASAVDYLRFGSTIPSGRTVSGALGYETASASDYREVVSFYPLKAPANVVDANVSFDTSTVSALAAQNSEESANCTGTASTPTAPAGKVCIYLSGENVAPNSAVGTTLDPAIPTGSDLGFSVTADASGANGTFLTGTWAYTAP